MASPQVAGSKTARVLVLTKSAFLWGCLSARTAPFKETSSYPIRSDSARFFSSRDVKQQNYPDDEDGADERGQSHGGLVVPALPDYMLRNQTAPIGR